MKKYIDSANFPNSAKLPEILRALPKSMLILVLSSACQFDPPPFNDLLIECPDNMDQGRTRKCIKVNCPPGTEDNEDIVCVGSADMHTSDMNMGGDFGSDMNDMGTPDMMDMHVREDMGTDMDTPDMNMGGDFGSDMNDMGTPDMMDMNIIEDMETDMNMGEPCTTLMLTQRNQIIGVLDNHEAIMSSSGSMFNGNKYGNNKFTLEFGPRCGNQVSNYKIATVNGVNVAKATNQNCEASYRFTNGPIGNRDNTETTTKTFTNGGTFLANFGGSNGGVIPTGQPSLTVELDANGQLKVNGQPSTLCTSYENEIITKINN